MVIIMFFFTIYNILNKIVYILIFFCFFFFFIQAEDGIRDIWRDWSSDVCSSDLSSGCSFRRIQFTPDLLPSDVSGVSIYNQKTGDFEFREGPLIAQVVLADEINRATPKTQSALLEAMEERQITVDGVTRAMPRPFMVLATQNPIEYEGTFPLPEAQLDRFMVRVHLGYPTATDEVIIMDRQQHRHPVEDIGQVTDAPEVLRV